MASDAPITGAPRRAPRNRPGDVSPQHTLDRMIVDARLICVAAEEIDALALAVEMMMENQRGIMRDQNAGTFLCDNELWSGMATLLAMVRTQAADVGHTGEAIEIAGQRAGQPAAA